MPCKLCPWQVIGSSEDWAIAASSVNLRTMWLLQWKKSYLHHYVDGVKRDKSTPERSCHVSRIPGINLSAVDRWLTTLSNIGEAIAFLELLLAEMTGQHHCDVDIHSIG